MASGGHVAFYIPMHWIGRGHLFLFAASPLFRDLALVLNKEYIEKRSTESVKFLFMPILEARAEILKIFLWFFGRNDDIKKSF